MAKRRRAAKRAEFGKSKKMRTRPHSGEVESHVEEMINQYHAAVVDPLVRQTLIRAATYTPWYYRLYLFYKGTVARRRAKAAMAKMRSRREETVNRPSR